MVCKVQCDLPSCDISHVLLCLACSTLATLVSLLFLRHFRHTIPYQSFCTNLFLPEAFLQSNLLGWYPHFVQDSESKKPVLIVVSKIGTYSALPSLLLSTYCAWFFLRSTYNQHELQLFGIWILSLGPKHQRDRVLYMLFFTAAFQILKTMLCT